MRFPFLRKKPSPILRPIVNVFRVSHEFKADQTFSRSRSGGSAIGEIAPPVHSLPLGFHLSHRRRIRPDDYVRSLGPPPPIDLSRSLVAVSSVFFRIPAPPEMGAPLDSEDSLDGNGGPLHRPDLLFFPTAVPEPVGRLDQRYSAGVKSPPYLAQFDPAVGIAIPDGDPGFSSEFHPLLETG